MAFVPPALKRKRASVTCTTGRRNTKNGDAATGREPDQTTRGPGRSANNPAPVRERNTPERARARAERWRRPIFPRPPSRPRACCRPRARGRTSAAGASLMPPPAGACTGTGQRARPMAQPQGERSRRADCVEHCRPLPAACSARGEPPGQPGPVPSSFIIDPWVWLLAGLTVSGLVGDVGERGRLGAAATGETGFHLSSAGSPTAPPRTGPRVGGSLAAIVQLQVTGRATIGCRKPPAACHSRVGHFGAAWPWPRRRPSAS